MTLTIRTLSRLRLTTREKRVIIIDTRDRDRRENIYQDDVDRQDFLKVLAETCQKTDWQVHAWMPANAKPEKADAESKEPRHGKNQPHLGLLFVGFRNTEPIRP